MQMRWWPRLISTALATASCTPGCAGDLPTLRSPPPDVVPSDAAGILFDAIATQPDANAVTPMGTDADASVPTQADTGADSPTPTTRPDDSGPDAFGSAFPDAGAQLYRPCPPAAPCAIMPLGDSITHGDGSNDYGGYREPLFHLANQANQSITFVGRMLSGPNTVDSKPFPRSSEGYPGYTIDDSSTTHGISSLVSSGISQTKPNIITLMIGTNDVDRQIDLANAPARLGALVDRIVALDANVLVVVAKIVPTTDDTQNALVQAYNAGIPAVVRTRAAAGKHVLLVDMYAAFTADPNFKGDYISGKIHPNEMGYAVMAKTWYAAIGSFLK